MHEKGISFCSIDRKTESQQLEKKSLSFQGDGKESFSNFSENGCPRFKPCWSIACHSYEQVAEPVLRRTSIGWGTSNRADQRSLDLFFVHNTVEESFTQISDKEEVLVSTVFELVEGKGLATTRITEKTFLLFVAEDIRSCEKGNSICQKCSSDSKDNDGKFSPELIRPNFLQPSKLLNQRIRPLSEVEELIVLPLQDKVKRISLKMNYANNIDIT